MHCTVFWSIKQSCRTMLLVSCKTNCKTGTFNFTEALVSRFCALWCWKSACFPIFPHAVLHHSAVSQSPSSPCTLSLRVSLVGITWSPQEKPNQASTKLRASFVCRQRSAVEIPLCLRLIIYRYLTTGNHDPGGRSGGSKVTPGASPLLGCDLCGLAEGEKRKLIYFTKCDGDQEASGLFFWRIWWGKKNVVLKSVRIGLKTCRLFNILQFNNIFGICLALSIMATNKCNPLLQNKSS